MKLGDALWAYRTGYKKPMGMCPYKMVYGKAFHLPLELEHNALCDVRELNADPKLAGEKCLMNLTSLDEWRNEAYESAKMFKEKVKKWHDKRILKCEFNVADKVLLCRSRFRFSPGKLLSRWEGPFHIEEVYRTGAIKINNFEGTKPQVVNGQRLKHYMAGDPINVDANMIYTSTHEEHVAAKFRIPAGAESEKV